MEDNNIRRYAKLMEELGLTGLEIKEDGCQLRLERTVCAPVAAPVVGQHVPETPENAAVSDGCIDICSPMVGVFYSAPAENSQPFVSVGDTVKRGDVLCIIEAMKLMNEIVSEYDGVVEEICAVNNQVVDFGHRLFRLKRER
jgi:acetyl-CoA carboxylase biotin carboxyl carrier protein